MFLVAAGYTLSVENGDFYSTSFRIVVGVIVYTLIIYYLLLPFFWCRNFRRNKILQKEQTYIFHEDGLEASSSIGTGKIEWSDFFKWKSGGDMILVYPAPNLFYLIPKRIFDTEDEFHNIHDLLLRCLGKPKT